MRNQHAAARAEGQSFDVIVLRRIFRVRNTTGVACSRSPTASRLTFCPAEA